MRSTKKALLLSMMSMLLCVAMLMGTTFAWFTDSVTSGANKIVAGNLDIELEYSKTGADGSWKTVEGKTDLFSDVTLWEPGATSVVYLKLTNKGTLALKYNLAITATGGVFTNAADQSKNLKDALKFAQVAGANLVTYATREEAVAATASAVLGLKDYAQANHMAANDVSYITLVVTMPTTVDDEFNYKTDTDAPTINLGIELNATQYATESDSFDKYYDVTATPIDVYTVEEFTKAVAQAKTGDTINVMTAGLDLTVEYTDTKTLTLRGEKINTLTANIPNGTIHVYNEVATVECEDVDYQNSAHFYNKIGTLNAKAGHVVIEAGAVVENIIESPVLDTANDEEKANAKELLIEVKGVANTITTPTANPVKKAETKISGTVGKLDVKAVKENVSIDIGDNENAKIEELAVDQTYDGELNITGDTSKIEKSNVTFKGEEPGLSELFEALSNKEQGVIPEKITIAEDASLKALSDEHKGLAAELDGVTTTINLEATLSVGSNYDPFGNNFGAMRVQGQSGRFSDITFTGNENGKFTSVGSSVNSPIYAEGAFKITFAGGTYESENSIVIMNYMGGDSASQSFEITGGTFKITNTSKDSKISVLSGNANKAIIQHHGAPDSVIITGGTFYNCDPSQYVATGYTVSSKTVGNDIIYTVVPEAN